MKEQEIELLDKQIKKLDAEDFDLEAWKTGTVIILERIFGPHNQKITQLEKIKYDQSSWALREAKGSKNMMATCKKQGKEIIEMAIAELTHLGLPDEKNAMEAAPFKGVIVKSLENELKISQYREVVSILNSDRKPEGKRKELTDKLHEFGYDVAENILIGILMAEETKRYL